MRPNDVELPSVDDVKKDLSEDVGHAKQKIMI
jgi:hypothetical protein